jgi:hypothetical protein
MSEPVGAMKCFVPTRLPARASGGIRGRNLILVPVRGASEKILIVIRCTYETYEVLKNI